MKLKRNMNTIDQILRGFMGAGLIYLGPGSDILTTDILSSVLLALVGVFTLFSAITAHCSIYNIAGFGTYKDTDVDSASQKD